MCVRVLHTAKLIQKRDKSKFLPHTDLTDENRLIYSADAAAFNTDFHKIFDTDKHGQFVKICAIISVICVSGICVRCGGY